jgi:hypothetical protein
MTKTDKENPSVPSPRAEAPRKPLTPAAERALAEAEERRAAQNRAAAAQKVAEVGGRDGPEPTRYGDWEKGGIVSDF